MVSEVVMYQTMFLLGILMFGFFSLTFNNYSNLAKDLTVETNVNIVLNKINSLVVDIINNGRSLKSVSDSIKLSVKLNIESDFAGTPYVIFFTVTSPSNVSLSATIGASSKISSSTPLNFYNGAGSSQINFSGKLSSNDANPLLFYVYNGVTESVYFS